MEENRRNHIEAAFRELPSREIGQFEPDLNAARARQAPRLCLRHRGSVDRQNIETLFGTRDENVRLLEDGLNVTINLRSNSIEIEGAARDVARVEQVGRGVGGASPVVANPPV